MAKVTAALAEEVAGCEPDDEVEVIVELHPEPAPEAGTRAERVEAMKQGFEQSAADVGTRIEELGGEVVESAWINQSLRTKVPKKAIEGLEEDERIAALDVPRAIEAEG